MSAALNVLLVSHVKPGFANTCLDHQDALRSLGRNRVAVLSPFDYPDTALDLRPYDIVAVHYSIICYSHVYLPPAWRRALQDFVGLKVIFIQDEHRDIWAANDAMIRLGVDVLFTCVPSHCREAIYGQLSRRGVRIEHTLTGYVPDALLHRSFRPLQERPLDAVYRGRPLPYSLGRLSTEKVDIARRFCEAAPQHGLRYDVDWREESRIYGKSWNEFLASGRCALGTESGASICDFSGDVDRAIRLYMQERPHASYEEAFADVLSPFEGNVTINTISPRVFEAIALGTALVQFPGEYSGVLEAGRHYIVLEKDFSNFREVADAMRNLPLLKRMVRDSYDDVIRSEQYSYRSFAAHFDDIVRQEWELRIHRDPVPMPALLQRTGDLGPSFVAGRSDLDLQRWAEASLQPPPEDYARAEAGARISNDSGFFERPHDADYVLRPAHADGYAAALSHDLLPQWIEIDLGEVRTVHALRLDWYSDDNFGRTYMVEGRAEQTEPWLMLAAEADNAELGWEREVSAQAVRWMRLTVWSFTGQQRILLRRFSALGTDLRKENRDSIPATASNLLQLSRGTRIVGSSGCLDVPHDCAGLLSDYWRAGTYSAVGESAALPHWIEFDLAEEYVLQSVWLAWLSVSDRCTAFRLLGRRADRQWFELANRAAEMEVFSLVLLDGPRARYLRLEASHFLGRQQLVLRAMNVIGNAAPPEPKPANQWKRLISRFQSN